MSTRHYFIHGLFAIIFLLSNGQIVFSASDYDLRFSVVTNTDTDFAVTIMLKRNTDTWDKLGSSNFRFYFNAACLDNPILQSAHGYSGGSYGDMTITNGSSWVSVNIYLMLVNNGTDVPTNWTEVATIHFDVITPAQTSALSWDSTNTTAWDDDEATQLGQGTFTDLDIFVLVEGITSIPVDFALSQNYPNPFNPQTRLEYQLPHDTEVFIVVCNLLGKKVISLVDAHQTAGYYSITWDGLDDDGCMASSGIYLVHLQTDSFIQVRKVTLMR